MLKNFAVAKENMATAKFLFILRGASEQGTMPIVSRLIFQAVQWKSRRGLHEEDGDVIPDANTVDTSGKKEAALRTGVRGETYAYWYLRRHGYVFVARNYTVTGVKGEIDLIGYDGDTLAFVEVRTRTMRKGMTALPELSVTPEKQHVVVRTAKRYLAQRHVKDGPIRFDVLAIDNHFGEPPVVRLHKDAFSPQM